MTERLRMLCVKPDRPVDPITVSIMREIDAVAKEMNLSYFLVGAVARDVLLGHVFGLNPEGHCGHGVSTDTHTAQGAAQ